MTDPKKPCPNHQTIDDPGKGASEEQEPINSTLFSPVPLVLAKMSAGDSAANPHSAAGQLPPAAVGPRSPITFARCLVSLGHPCFPNFAIIVATGIRTHNSFARPFHVGLYGGNQGKVMAVGFEGRRIRHCQGGRSRILSIAFFA